MHLHAALASDEQYIRHLGICVKSLLDHNAADFDGITLHLIENNISQASRQALANLCGAHPAHAKVELCFYADDLLETRLDGKFRKFSPSMCSRLLLPELLDETIKQVLYLDCDAVVNGSLRRLFDLPITGWPAAAVQDEFIARKYRQTIGLAPDDLYFNSGFLYLDLALWRQEHLAEKAIEAMNTLEIPFTYPDQDAINLVLKGKIFSLPPEYNVKPAIFLFRYENLALNVDFATYYSEDELRKAKAQPIFIHYAGAPYRRPWQEHCTHPLKMAYEEVLSQTPWADTLLEEDTRTLLQKLKDQLLIFLFGHCPLPVIKAVLGFRGHL